MAMLRQTPPPPFAEVAQGDLELRGLRARAFQFPEGVRDPSRAVLCIAGMGANGRSFARQRPLARTHFFLLLNTPHETPPSLDPIEFAADCVEEFIDHEGLDRPLLVGSSFGGAVATRVAARRRERLRGLVLVDAVLSRRQVPLASPRFVDLLEAPEPLARLVAPLAAQVMGGFQLDRTAREELVREARVYDGRELKRRLLALMDVDLLPQLPSLSLPSLWVHGRRDLLVPWRRARKAARTIPGAEFALVAGAGHVPYLSHPTEFNALLGRFLARVDGPPWPALDAMPG